MARGGIVTRCIFRNSCKFKAAEQNASEEAVTRGKCFGYNPKCPDYRQNPKEKLDAEKKKRAGKAAKFRAEVLNEEAHGGGKA